MKLNKQNKEKTNLGVILIINFSFNFGYRAFIYFFSMKNTFFHYKTNNKHNYDKHFYFYYVAWCLIWKKEIVIIAQITITAFAFNVRTNAHLDIASIVCTASNEMTADSCTLYKYNQIDQVRQNFFFFSLYICHSMIIIAVEYTYLLNRY